LKSVKGASCNPLSLTSTAEAGCVFICQSLEIKSPPWVLERNIDCAVSERIQD